ncbi:hypothetical protein [Novosphingobium gossypii]|uniref:hypothetical protein n=1 Tax=Novosphingobium gossypii TaxID=1604774 RepID=UPI003D19658D
MTRLSRRAAITGALVAMPIAAMPVIAAAPVDAQFWGAHATWRNAHQAWVTDCDMSDESWGWHVSAVSSAYITMLRMPVQSVKAVMAKLEAAQPDEWDNHEAGDILALIKADLIRLTENGVAA